MKKSLLLFLFGFFLFSASGQLSIELELLDETVLENVDLGNEWLDLDFKIKVENTGTEDAELKWVIQPSEENCVEAWDFYGCDNNICYIPGIFSNVNPHNTELPNIPSELAAGESYEFSFHLRANGTAGCCDILFTFASIHDPDIILASLEIPISVNDPECSGLVDINDPLIESLEIYPNPVEDYLWLTVNNLVETIEVMDVSGKLRSRLNAIQINQFDLSGLSAGIYFLRLRGEQGINLKTMRIVKK